MNDIPNHIQNKKLARYDVKKLKNIHIKQHPYIIEDIGDLFL